jgi:type I restriction enzyme S subunit
MNGIAPEPLGRHAAVLMGQSPPSSACSENGAGLPFIQGNAEFGPRHPTPRLRCSAPTRIAEQGDLLMSVRAPVGEVNQAHTRIVIGRGLSAIRVDQQMSTFLWHALKWAASQLNRIAQGSTFVAVSRSDVESLLIPWSNTKTCSRIAVVLDAIDATIEQTTAIIKKLKQVRSGLLRDLLTCGIDEHGHIRDPSERPEEFQHSPLGPIHKTWRTERLARLSTQIVDGVHHTPTYIDRGVPFLTVENLTRGSSISLDPCRFVSPEAHAEYRCRAQVRPHDVLVTKDGTLGVARVVPEGFPEVSIFVSVAVIHAKLNLISLYLIREFFGTEWFSRQLAQLSAGTGLKHIHLEHFKQFVLPVPPPNEQAAIIGALQDLDHTLDAEVNELEKLTNIKSGLSTDLLTGRVRVSETLENPEATQ